MKKTIQAMFLALGLFAMAQVDAACSGCSKEKSSIIECLCSLANLDLKQKTKRTVAYVDNTSSCSTPNGTRECPYPLISEAILSEVDIIYVLGTEVSYEIDETITVLEGQELIGLEAEVTTKNGLKAKMKPSLQIPTNVEKGVVLNSRSRLAGFDIDGQDSNLEWTDRVAVYSEAGDCTIEDNEVRDIARAVYFVAGQPASKSSSGINVRANTFKNLSEGAYFGVSGISRILVRKNLFEDVAYGLLGEITSGPDCDWGVEENTFRRMNFGTIGISVQGTPLLRLIKNTVFAYAQGFRVGNSLSQVKAAIAPSTFTATGNSFTITDTNVVSLYDKVVVSDNLFDGSQNASFGLEAFLGGKATACIRGNRFRSNQVGFSIDSDAMGLADAPCLQLIDNNAEGNMEAGFRLNDGPPAASQTKSIHRVQQSASSHFLKINQNYASVNRGFMQSGDLNTVGSCSGCPRR